MKEGKYRVEVNFKELKESDSTSFGGRIFYIEVDDMPVEVIEKYLDQLKDSMERELKARCKR